MNRLCLWSLCSVLLLWSAAGCSNRHCVRSKRSHTWVTTCTSYGSNGVCSTWGTKRQAVFTCLEWKCDKGYVDLAGKCISQHSKLAWEPYRSRYLARLRAQSRADSRRKYAERMRRKQAQHTEPCRRGRLRSCLKVGNALLHTDPASRKLALWAYGKACALGSGLACNEMGGLLLVQKQKAQAAAAYAKGCQRRHAASCAKLAIWTAAGYGVAQDRARAEQLYRKACQLRHHKSCRWVGRVDQGRRCQAGEAQACFSVGRFYEQQGKAPAKAVWAYRRSCQGKIGKACYRLGMVLYRQRDKPGATAAFAQGCALKIGRSCTELGSAYERGSGVPQDKAKAMVFYKQACKLWDRRGCKLSLRDTLHRKCQQGVAQACYRLGNSYLYRKPQSRAKALQTFRKGCRAGGGDSCLQVGYILRDKGDKAGAVAHYAKGCQLNFKYACNTLGMAYAKGRGVPADKAKARAAFRKACQLGYKDACWRGRRR